MGTNTRVPGTLKGRSRTLMLDETRDPKQTFLVESGMQERMNLIQMNDLNDVNQMSYK